MVRLSSDLTARFGRGFGLANLHQMRGFDLAYQHILQTPSGGPFAWESPERFSRRRLEDSAPASRGSTRSPVPSTLVALRSAPFRPVARSAELLRDRSASRRLDRAATRSADRNAVLRTHRALQEQGRDVTKGAQRRPQDAVTAEEEIKDPLVLEFLGLKDEYSESEVEEALILHLERFILELGGDLHLSGDSDGCGLATRGTASTALFPPGASLPRRDRSEARLFDARRRRADHLYLNYAREHWTRPDENPPVGLIPLRQEGRGSGKVRARRTAEQGFLASLSTGPRSRDEKVLEHGSPIPADFWRRRNHRDVGDGFLASEGQEARLHGDRDGGGLEHVAVLRCRARSQFEASGPRSR